MAPLQDVLLFRKGFELQSSRVPSGLEGLEGITIQPNRVHGPSPDAPRGPAAPPLHAGEPAVVVRGLPLEVLEHLAMALLASRTRLHVPSEMETKQTLKKTQKNSKGLFIMEETGISVACPDPKAKDGCTKSLSAYARNQSPWDLGWPNHTPHLLGQVCGQSEQLKAWRRLSLTS